jgi:DNA repair protein RecO (recombination protein O)
MRVEQQEGFVLHARDYRETSLLLEVFTRRHGRLGLVAKGAKRNKSPWRGILQPFVPLRFGWSGRGELCTLTAAEISGVIPLPTGERMFCAFYLNELLVRLLHRYDAHEGLFDSYINALESLSGAGAWEPVLRIFEKRLLAELGYALVLDRDVSGAPVEAENRYRYLPELGPARAENDDEHGILVRGATLIALQRESFPDSNDLRDAKHLMRMMLGLHLNGKPLHSRRLFQRLRSMTRGTDVMSGNQDEP